MTTNFDVQYCILIVKTVQMFELFELCQLLWSRAHYGLAPVFEVPEPNAVLLQKFLILFVISLLISKLKKILLLLYHYYFKTLLLLLF